MKNSFSDDYFTTIRFFRSRKVTMSSITTTVVYEQGVLRPTEKIKLVEHRAYKAVLLPLTDQEETAQLSDEETIAQQRLALQKLAGIATTDEQDDASVEHDYYLYA